MLLQAVCCHTAQVFSTLTNIQDLDSAIIRQSHKHPTLCTVVVDGFHGKAGSPSSPSSQAEGHYWRLPSTDPRDEGKFLFRLHTVDLYFWTPHDAQVFVDAARKTLQEEQLDIITPPAPAPHAEVMSPVVQQLENIAISDPAYHNGQTRTSRTTSVASPLPPSAQLPKEDLAKKEGTNFTPLAYNPAAPPAPEVIKHREKTPPPPDAVAGTGLAAAAYHEQMQTLGPQGHGAYMTPPPGTFHLPPGNTGQQPSYNSSGYGSLPATTAYTPSPSVSTQGNRSSSVSSFPPPPPKSAGGSTNPYIPQNLPPANSNTTSPQPTSSAYAPPPTNKTQSHLYTPGITPMESPATQILGDSYVSGPPQPLQHLQPQYADYLSSRPQPPEPVGGYSDYQYEQPSRHHSRSHDSSIHSQVYRPTEEEAHGHGKHRPSGAGQGQQSGKLEAKAEQAEKKVNKFLRKIEKKLG